MSTLPACPEGLELKYTPNGLALTDGDLEMIGDFTEMLPRLKQSNLEKEFLVRASKLKDAPEHPIVLDATAGMGEDSLILAAAGFNVKMFELDPVICALLKDTLSRAMSIPELSPIVSRMEVTEGDSIEAMKALDHTPDLILLDPMFPARNKSALIKKKFQLLQKLERPCSNGEELLNAAIAVHPRKIIIKRPLKGPLLADVKPSYSLKGKAIRYDCLVYAPK